MMTVAEVQKMGNIVNTVTLTSLAFEDTNDLVADTLNCSTELAQPKVIHFSQHSFSKHCTKMGALRLTWIAVTGNAILCR